MQVYELIQELEKCNPYALVWANVYIDLDPTKFIGSVAVIGVQIDLTKRPILNIATVMV